jgi:hypothetical protein
MTFRAAARITRLYGDDTPAEAQANLFESVAIEEPEKRLAGAAVNGNPWTRVFWVVDDLDAMHELRCYVPRNHDRTRPPNGTATSSVSSRPSQYAPGEHGQTNKDEATIKNGISMRCELAPSLIRPGTTPLHRPRGA